jgi:Uma2 family endonuclease
MTTSAAEYERIALSDPDTKWELVCGRLRRKPDMTMEHNLAARVLATLLGRQLDLEEYSVGTDSARLRISTGTYYVPDLCVVPMSYVRRLAQSPDTFEVYEDPVPLVVEVWSKSTGDYDIDDKLAEYQLRGDREIWRLHPYERTLIAWCRQPDGSYEQSSYRDGTVTPIALPGVTIDLDTVFR